MRWANTTVNEAMQRVFIRSFLCASLFLCGCRHRCHHRRRDRRGWGLQSSRGVASCWCSTTSIPAPTKSTRRASTLHCRWQAGRNGAARRPAPARTCQPPPSPLALLLEEVLRHRRLAAGRSTCGSMSTSTASPCWRPSAPRRRNIPRCGSPDFASTVRSSLAWAVVSPPALHACCRTDGGCTGTAAIQLPWSINTRIVVFLPLHTKSRSLDSPALPELAPSGCASSILDPGHLNDPQTFP